MKDYAMLDPVMEKAADAFRAWRETDVRERVRCFNLFSRCLRESGQPISEAVSAETRRPLAESLSQEILPVLEMTRYCTRNIARWLAPRPAPYLRPGFMRKRNLILREPLGVLGILAPGNFPFSMGMMSLVYACLIGNTVLLKPSEKSRLVPPLIEGLLRDSGLAARGVAQVVSGGPDVGQAIIAHPTPQKIIFFGDRRSGESISRSCVTHSKSLLVESGGGCTAFVLDDADLAIASKGLAWSSFYSNGRSCVSTERIIVDRKVFEGFLGRFAAECEKVAATAHSQESDGEIERIEGLLRSAAEEGAVIRRVGSGAIILDPPVGGNVWNKDIFGPVVMVAAAEDARMAALELGETSSPLGVSIWSGNLRSAENLAKKVWGSMVWINDSSFGLPHLPWGGWGKAGRGTLFSEESLGELTRLKWISRHPRRWAQPRFWWHPYGAFKEWALKKAVRYFR